MPALKVTAFGGMVPAQDDTLIAETNSAYTLNTYLDSGALQGLKLPKEVYTLQNPTYRYVFRLPLIAPDKNHIASSKWVEFEDADTNVLKSPVANDAFERFYFASPSQPPKYNTKTRMLADDPPFLLGIPTPATAPSVTPSGGVSGTTEIRGYVYTWVSAYGEEGPPSPPTLVTGKIDDTFAVTMTAPTTGDTDDRNLSKVRIYRTITANTGTATFYLVAEQDISDLTYDDTTSDVTLSGNLILDTADHGGPPTDLKGWVSMPNGMIAGWRDNEIWFCEPFKPWAWPAEYTVSLDANVVGLGVVGQTLVIPTEGFPYAATGISPANMAFSKIGTFEPCMSRASIISTAQGVFYASPNGVVLAAYGVVQNATASLATRDKWLDLVRPETLRAARLGASYYAWGSVEVGCFDPVGFEPTAFEQFDFTNAYGGILISFTDPRVAWVQMSTQGISTDNVMTDIWSGEIFIIREGEVLWLDITSGNISSPYLWRSKRFQLDEIRNLTCMKVWFTESVDDPDFILNSVRNIDTNMTLQPDQYGLIRSYADGRLVMTRELRHSGELMRLPSGFKADEWQFEIEARVKITSFQVATSAKELARI